MTTQHTHESASHALRCLCIDKGSLYDEDCLDYLIDELREAHKENGHLIADRNEARRKVGELIATLKLYAPDLRREQERAVDECKKIAAEQTRKLGG